MTFLDLQDSCVLCTGNIKLNYYIRHCPEFISILHDVTKFIYCISCNKHPRKIFRLIEFRLHHMKLSLPVSKTSFCHFSCKDIHVWSFNPVVCNVVTGMQPTCNLNNNTQLIFMNELRDGLKMAATTNLVTIIFKEIGTISLYFRQNLISVLFISIDTCKYLWTWSTVLITSTCTLMRGQTVYIIVIWTVHTWSLVPGNFICLVLRRDQLLSQIDVMNKLFMLVHCSRCSGKWRKLN